MPRINSVSVDVFLSSHYMRQILEALRYCHDNNVIHRDVKVRFIDCKWAKADKTTKRFTFSNRKTKGTKL